VSPRAAFTASLALSVLLVAAAACGADVPDPGLLEARLRSLFDRAEPSPPADDLRAELARELRSPDATAAGAFPTRDTLAALYTLRGYRLVWHDEAGRRLPRTATLLDALRRAGEHGLVPRTTGWSASRHGLPRTARPWSISTCS
jgi:hypothetical protein